MGLVVYDACFFAIYTRDIMRYTDLATYIILKVWTSRSLTRLCFLSIIFRADVSYDQSSRSQSPVKVERRTCTLIGIDYGYQLQH
jgi:hypothetical protein